MSTSGSSDWTRTRDQIILRALRQLGVQDQEESSTNAAYVANAAEALNALAKSWVNKGLGKWLQTEGTLTLVAGQASYTMGPGGDVTYRPQSILSIRYRDSSSRDLPLESMSRGEYFDLPDKATSGALSGWYYDPQIPQGVLYIWQPLQTGLSGTLRITYTRSLQDFDSAGDNPDFPETWINALTWGLAFELMAEYPPSNQIRAQAIPVNAQRYLSEAMAYDGAGGSYFFQPASESWR